MVAMNKVCHLIITHSLSERLLEIQSYIAIQDLLLRDNLYPCTKACRGEYIFATNGNVFFSQDILSWVVIIANRRTHDIIK